MDTYMDFKHYSGQDRSKKSAGQYPSRGRTPSSASSGGGNVLGRFLKLAKSKSDANGYGNKGSRNRPASYPYDDFEDDFRISPRPGAERMVHKGNSRKEVSRSHSWIYGSVKLSSDLPFGYGNAFSPGGSSSSSSSPSLKTPQQQSSRSCHKSSEVCGTCDCTNDFDFLRPDVQPYPPIQDGISYCTAHGNSHLVAGPMPHPGLPSYYLPENSKAGRHFSNSHRHKGQADFLSSINNQDSGNKLISSVRSKLTWKSLKQAVKKRPSLDNVLKSKSNPPPNGNHPMHGPMHSPPPLGPGPQDALLPPGTNYFFPDKKHYYASCTDLYGENPPYVTASVRVRPKRPRQPWPFPNEFGPVPNYQEDEIYHSEWDLRQFMPYDVWLNATNNNPIFQSVPSEVTKIPKISRTSSGPLHPLPDLPTSHTTFERNKAKQEISPSRPKSTASTPTGSVSSKKSVALSSSKRSSILESDITAYQLIKSTSKSPSVQGSKPVHTQQSDSDELSDNALNDDPVRIGGQGIYMPATAVISPSNGGATPLSKPSLNHSSNFAGELSFQETSKLQVEQQNARRIDKQKNAAPEPSVKTQKSVQHQAPVVKRQEIRTSDHVKSTSVPSNYPNNANEPRRDFQGQGAPSAANVKSPLKTYFSQTPPPLPSKSNPNSNSIYQAAVFNTGHMTDTQSKFASWDESCKSKDCQTSQGSQTDDLIQTRGSLNKMEETELIYDTGKADASTSTASNPSSGGGNGNRYGALKKRKPRSSSSSSSAGQTSSSGSNSNKVLFKDTIYEEDSEHSDDNKTYAVKIIVSQNSSSEYVKPILKKERPVLEESSATSSSSGKSASFQDQDLVKDNGSFGASTSSFNTGPGPRSTKKVQFNQNQTIVCQGLSEDDEEEHDDEGEDSDDTLVREPTQLHNDWITVEELAVQADPTPVHGTPNDEHSSQPTFSVNVGTNCSKNQINGAQVNNPERAGAEHELIDSKSHNSSHLNVFKQQTTAVTQPQHGNEDTGSETQGGRMLHQPPVYNAPPPGKNLANQNSSPARPVQKSTVNQNHAQSAKASPSAVKSPSGLHTQKKLPDSTSSPAIINPNSLLFHDTTRIRLNQTRPSLENSFKLNISGQSANRGGKKGSNDNATSHATKIKQSNSFRHPAQNNNANANPYGSAPLRPREPPPPPPAAMKKQVSGTASSPPLLKGKEASRTQAKTTSGSERKVDTKAKEKVNPSTGRTYTKSQPKVTNNQATLEPPVKTRVSSVSNSSSSQKSSSGPARPSVPDQQQRAIAALSEQISKLGQRNKPVSRPHSDAGNPGKASSSNLSSRSQGLTPNGTLMSPITIGTNPKSQPKNEGGEQQNIEIVTKENSVSEIRIYSTPTVSLTERSEAAPQREISASRSTQEMHYASTDLLPPAMSHPTSAPVSPALPSSETGVQGTHFRQMSAPSSITSPQSTSVVLIIGSESGETNYSALPLTGPSPQPKVETKTAAPAPPPLPAPATRPAMPMPQPGPPRHLVTSNNRSNSPTPSEQRGLFSVESHNTTNRIRAVSNEYVSQPQMKAASMHSHAEPLYDDVINQSQIIPKDVTSRSSTTSENSAPPPLPANPPPADVPHVEEPIYSDASHCLRDDAFDKLSTYNTSTYSSHLGDKGQLIYDDTLSLISSNYGSHLNNRDGRKLADILTDLEEDVEEPIYDDVINLIVPDSDSGAETEEPPPLPAQGPPLHLPKVSMDLPVLNFPLLTHMEKEGHKERKQSNGTYSQSDFTNGRQMPYSTRKETAKEENPLALLTDQAEAHASGAIADSEEDILDRTRSLLMELSEKLTKLNFPATTDYSTYISKVIISSSSESSGVEEDYTSEKNYSLSRTFTDDQYRLNAISKLASETISMARGKFLDSMKMNTSSNASHGLQPPLPIGNEHRSHADLEEPIYEEIRDFNHSTSPIYADAFDSKSFFESAASRNEILSFLETIRDRLTATKTSSLESGSSSNSVQKARKSAEIERNDSGIGSESGSLPPASTPPSDQLFSAGLPSDKTDTGHFLCSDCNQTRLSEGKSSSDSASSRNAGGEGTVCGEPQELTIMGQRVQSSLCASCLRKRSERKEILQEIYETELKYGRDLKIIEDEFYNPIQAGGLLTKEQLEQIFLNVHQLIQINQQLTTTLQSSFDTALNASDDDLISVNVGKIFMDYGEVMMSAFESYCTRQATAGSLLAQLEKEKELLRIFLRVSQMENAVLRRMNLPAFLMVPVQRVTRYPLLLARLLKVTPRHHASRDELFLAQEKIEQHLEHMNKTTRDVGSVKLWRRISSINGASSPVHRRSSSDIDGANVRIRKMALDVLDWANFADVTSVIESQLGLVHFNGKNLRNIYGCLLARGKQLESLASKMDQAVFFPPAEDIVKDAKLVLVRVKNTRFCLLREPFCLSKCVISQGENEFQDFIEINEIITKNTYYFQAMDKQGTADWLRLLQCHALCVGQWRRRRGALANIMMNGMIRHV